MLKAKCKEVLRSIANGFESISNTAGADPQKLAEVSAEALYKLAKEPNFGERLGTWVRASYLTSPGAHIMNIISNGVQIALQPLLTLMSGRPREAAAMLNLRALGEGFQLAGARFWSTFTNDALDPARVDFKGKIADNESLNKVLMSPLTLTRALDNASKAILETMTHQSLYHRIRDQIPEKFITKNNLSESALRKGINDLLLGTKSKNSQTVDLLKDAVPDINKYASYLTNVSDYVTFNRQLGDSLLDRGAKALEGVRDKHPLATFIFPFIKTPVNVAKEGAGYIPGIGFLREKRAKLDIARVKNEIEAINQGFKKAAERQIKLNESGDVLQQGALDAYRSRLEKALADKQGELEFLTELPKRFRAQQMIGAGLMMSSYGLWANGQMTGHFDDPEVRAMKEAQGIPPMSLRIGGKWVSYDKLEPLSTVMGMISDGFENTHARMRKGEPLDPKNSAALVFQTVTQNILNKTFTEQLGNMLMSFQQPERYGAPFTQLLNPVIPSAFAQVAKFNDPYARDIKGETTVESILNPLQARLPGMREQLPVKYDILGQPVQSSPAGSEGMRALDIFGGIKTVPTEQNVQQETLTNPYLEVGKLQRRVKGLDLTPDQYEEMTKQTGELVDKYVTKISASTKFQAMSEPMKAVYLKQVIESARTAGRDRYFGQLIKDPEMRQKYKENMYRKMGRTVPEGE